MHSLFRIKLQIAWSRCSARARPACRSRLPPQQSGQRLRRRLGHLNTRRCRAISPAISSRSTRLFWSANVRPGLPRIAVPETVDFAKLKNVSELWATASIPDRYLCVGDHHLGLHECANLGHGQRRADSSDRLGSLRCNADTMTITVNFDPRQSAEPAADVLRPATLCASPSTSIFPPRAVGTSRPVRRR